MPEQVTILGDGAMATVCSILLAQGGHEVTIWGAFEDSIERLIQNRENQRLLPGVRVPASVRLTANDADCFRDSGSPKPATSTDSQRRTPIRISTVVTAASPASSAPS